MAIGDILYACVECGRLESLRAAPDGGGEVCERCGARYTRVDGACIRVEPAGKPPETKSAAAWLDMLATAEPELPEAVPPEPVRLRIADTRRPYRSRGEYLGRIEDFGPEMGGILHLERDRLAFVSDTARMEWPLLDITAVQPSSRALQIKIRNGPLLSFKFPEGSAVLWEQRVQRALQERYADLGRGPILEFQPHIVTR